VSDEEWEKRVERAVEVSTYWFEKFHAANNRIKQWHDALTPLMPSDFKCWHQNNPSEWPEVTAGVIASQRERITQLEQENDAMRADLLLWDKAGIGFTTEGKP